MLSGSTVLPDSKETELGNNNQEVSSGVDISEVRGCHLLRKMSSQCGSQKLLQGLVSDELMAHFFIFNLFKLNE